MTELAFVETIPIQLGEGENLVLTLRLQPVGAPVPITPTPPTPGVRFELSYEDVADTLRPSAIALLGGGDPQLVFIGKDGRGYLEEVPPGLYSILPIFSDFFAEPSRWYLAKSGNAGGYQYAYKSFSFPYGVTRRTGEMLPSKDVERIYDGDRVTVMRRIIRFDSDGTAAGTDEVAEVLVTYRKGVPLSSPERLIMLIVLDGKPRVNV